MADKCLIGFKRGSTGKGFIYGETFDKIETCCKEFKLFFFNTGQCKERLSNFDLHTEEMDGLNLVSRGSAQRLILQINRTEKEVRFCPFCGAKIEIKCTKSVELKPKTKQVPDGHTEVTLWEESSDEKIECRGNLR